MSVTLVRGRPFWPQANVFLAGIVGVPWQNLARTDAQGNATLQAGLKTARELSDDGVWDDILGDPARGVLPKDPHMIESIEARSGLAPPSSPNRWADPINGHEFVVLDGSAGELQYACIFDLPDGASVDCSTVGSAPCDCNGDDVGDEKKPLCQADSGEYSNEQHSAKGYPSLRQLSVLKGIGEQAVEQRTIRFVGEGKAVSGTTLFLTCQQSSD